MKRIDLTKVRVDAGAPDPNMTNDEWQTYFRALKMLVEQKRLRRIEDATLLYSDKKYSENLGDAYYGDTIWQCYCQFINGILSFIRAGEEDYCFYIYQISELLKYEHDRLQTEWLPEPKCFRVWLTPIEN